MIDDEADFGSYLVTVAERDIDLLLMEEFHISGSFVAWFCEQLQIESATFAGAWHSVSANDGETDLLLRVRAGDRRIGILIENKVGAAEQETQDERYHIRGARSQREGKFDAFVVCICAPESYLDGLDEPSLYQYRVSYENIAAWFGQREGPRHEWRNHIMREAISQGRRGYTMVVNSVTTEFHMAYWEYLRRKHPQILMKKPTPKGSKSTWIILKTTNLPKRTHIDHKLDRSVVELGFDGRDVTDILAVKSDWPEDIFPVQRGRTAALSINVPRIEMAMGVAAQATLLEEVFAAVLKLAPFALLFGSRQ